MGGNDVRIPDLQVSEEHHGLLIVDPAPARCRCGLNAPMGRGRNVDGNMLWT